MSDPRTGTVAIALLLTLLASCGGNDQPPTSTAGTRPTAAPVSAAPLGLRYYSRVGGDGDALGVQVDASTGQDTIWSTFGGACVENCAASIDLVGETSSGVATTLWAARNFDQRGDGATVWELTDVLSIDGGLDAFGSYDCAVGVPLVDASNAIVKLMTVDLASGHFVEMPIDDGHCSVVGE